MDLERRILERMPDIERWLRAQVAGPRGAVLRIGRPAQRGLQDRAGRHQPVSRRLQQPQSRLHAAVRAGGASGRRARLPRRARRAARSRRTTRATRTTCRTSPTLESILRQARHERAHRLAQSRDHRAHDDRRSTTGARSSLEPIVRHGRRVGVADFDPCVVLLNNDLSSGVPQILAGHRPAGRAAAVRPAGTTAANRTTSTRIARSRANSPRCSTSTRGSSIRTSARAAQINFQERDGRGMPRDATSSRCSTRIGTKYREYGIEEKPFVIVKADAGTYGMGIMTVHDASEVIGLNRKQRNKMAVVKEGLEVSSVIIQEGVPTYEIDRRRDRRARRLHDRSFRRRRLLPRAHRARQGREPQRAGRAVRARWRSRRPASPISRGPRAARRTASTRMAWSRGSRRSPRRSKSRRWKTRPSSHWPPRNRAFPRSWVD